MKVKIQFFGHIQELVGQHQCTLDVKSSASAADVVADVQGLFPKLKEIKGHSIKIAVNTEYINEDALLQEGDILSFIPPVGGG